MIIYKENAILFLHNVFYFDSVERRIHPDVICYIAQPWQQKLAFLSKLCVSLVCALFTSACIHGQFPAAFHHCVIPGS